MKPLRIVAVILANGFCSADPLYTSEGKDPSFPEVLASGAIKPGERFSKGPVFGSTIRVNKDLLEKQTGKTGPLEKNIRLHTQGSGGISRNEFKNWTRWYQEDGNTQIFRLFAGEQNIRGGVGKSGSPGRVETFSKPIAVAPGSWHEWEGIYTPVKPVGANIFQLFHDGHLWAFHIRMSDNGEIYFARRRKIPGFEQRIVLATSMAGKSIAIKVRANGENYEVFKRNPVGGGDWELVTKGHYLKANENKISFRWGMYCGSRAGESVKRDAMLLVSGANFR
jgi:hypothetical protein